VAAAQARGQARRGRILLPAAVEELLSAAQDFVRHADWNSPEVRRLNLAAEAVSRLVAPDGGI
jgi:hypothetical protein